MKGQPMTRTDLATPPTRGALYRRFGPTALVTGASDGIGRAFAERLAAEGFDLILVARRAEALHDIARALKTRHGTQVEVVPADLSAPAAVSALLARTAGQPIGLVVAAAGFGSIGPFLEKEVESELDMIDLNCRSWWSCPMVSARAWRPRGAAGSSCSARSWAFTARRCRRPMRRRRASCRASPKASRR
jgi:NAD(P)-dependent dehydrogenase (short-subunit alcohol dehydrogenase family)